MQIQQPRSTNCCEARRVYDVQIYILGGKQCSLAGHSMPVVVAADIVHVAMRANPGRWTRPAAAADFQLAAWPREHPSKQLDRWASMQTFSAAPRPVSTEDWPTIQSDTYADQFNRQDAASQEKREHQKQEKREHQNS